jgi:hypothetical protein
MVRHQQSFLEEASESQWNQLSKKESRDDITNVCDSKHKKAFKKHTEPPPPLLVGCVCFILREAIRFGRVGRRRCQHEYVHVYNISTCISIYIYGYIDRDTYIYMPPRRQRQAIHQ